ncbi:MAG: nicotinate (nicotinamide) nucleotide adenylyltransferase [Gemmatimonadetes bacterium]|nr:nicotinate (nicotinamide) nucleotide adenylyltransferase [Gemmatimonadota bacterium]
MSSPATPAPRRIGLFGGSFDPPHVGHLMAAQDAIRELALDLLLVVPTAHQPLKEGHGAPAADRLAMVRLAFEGIPQVVVDAVEIERGGLSYTVDTVRGVRAQFPGAEVLLLVGADAVSSWSRWREVAALEAMVRLVVLRRPGSTVDEAAGGGHDGVPAGTQWLATRCVELSSTEVRERARAGESLRGFVPDAVAAYIERSGVYRGVTRAPPAGEGSARD